MGSMKTFSINWNAFLFPSKARSFSATATWVPIAQFLLFPPMSTFAAYNLNLGYRIGSLSIPWVSRNLMLSLRKPWRQRWPGILIFPETTLFRDPLNLKVMENPSWFSPRTDQGCRNHNWAWGMALIHQPMLHASLDGFQCQASLDPTDAVWCRPLVVITLIPEPLKNCGGSHSVISV